MGRGCIDPHFLDLGTNWRWVVSFTPLPIYTRGKSPLYPLDRRLGGAHSWSRRRGEEKILDPIRIRNPTPRHVQPVASRYTGYCLTSCSLVKVNRRFGGTHCLHYQGWLVSQARNQHETGSKGSSACYAVRTSNPTICINISRYLIGRIFHSLQTQTICCHTSSSAVVLAAIPRP
jgi:hypothetical protein